MSAPRLIPLDVAQMIATPPPRLEWVAAGLVVRGGVTMLSGSPGVGKSMLALMLGVSIVNGERFLDDATARGRVLYVDAENGRAEAHRRIHGLGLRADAADRLRYLTVNDQTEDGGRFDLSADIGELIGEATEHGADYIVLDSLRSLWGGIENESHTAILPMLAAARLARTARAGVMLLHHLDKGATAAYRGSSAFAGAAEIVATLRPDPRTKREETEAEADPELRCITIAKCRCAPEPPPRWLRLASESGITIIEKADRPPVPERSAPARDRLTGAILHELPADPARMTISTLASRVGVEPSSGSIKRVLRELIAQGRVVRDERGYAITGNAEAGANGPTPRVVGPAAPDTAALWLDAEMGRG
jgi:hypothetical protein